MIAPDLVTTVFETRIDVDEDVREKMIMLLNQQLADLVDLKSQTKQAHWNVRGPHFIAYHKMFDELAAQLDVPIDDTAERVGTLGGRAEGTARMAAGRSRLVDWNPDLSGGEEVVGVIADRFSYVAAYTRKAIERASDLGDEVSADLLTETSRSLDKALWFLEAHLQG